RFLLLPGPDGVQVGRLTATRLVVTDLDGRQSQAAPLALELSTFPAVQQTGVGLRAGNRDDGDTVEGLNGAGERRPRPKTPTQPAWLSPDGSRLGVRRERGGVTLYEIPSGRRMAQCDCDDDVGVSWVFSPDGRRIAAGGEGGRVHIWDVS